MPNGILPARAFNINRLIMAAFLTLLSLAVINTLARRVPFVNQIREGF